jgi:hypothetical protein
MQIPETIDKALHMAIVATNAEQEEKASARKDWGKNDRIFAVGSNREDVPARRHERYEKPRDDKTQWSGSQGSYPLRGGPTQSSRGGDGTHSRNRTDDRTPVHSEYKGGTREVGAKSGPKADDDR